MAEKTMFAVYKCRRCQAVFLGPACGRNMMIGAIANLCHHDYFYPHGCGISISRYELHQCEDGGFGFSDFIGAEEENG